MQTAAGAVYQFGQFEVNAASGELFKNGRRVKLQEQPFRLLVALLESPRGPVNREELRTRIWPEDTFVNFDDSLRVAVRKLREALGDDAEHPRYIETIPKRGYRFLGPALRLQETTPAPAATIRAATESVVAVLPFADLSPSPDSNYFCDGLAEDIMSGLTRVAGLRVIGRSSTALFRDRTLPLDDIAARLKADFVLDGSFRQSGNSVRITAQLIWAANQHCIWSERYDRELTDLFQVQEEIARAIVETLQIKVSPDPLIKQYTHHQDAHLFYLKGVFYSHRWTAEAFSQISSYMKRVVAIEPDHAPAWVELAGLLFGQMMAGVRPSKVMPEALESADRAVKADPNLAEARAILALLKGLWQYDWPGAIAESEVALRLNPVAPVVRYYRALVLTAMGQPEEAISELRRSLDSDPFSVLVNMQLCRLCTATGNYLAAIQYGKQAVEIGPHHFPGVGRLGEAYIYLGDYDRGITLLEQCRSSAPTEGWYTAVLAAAYRGAARQREAEQIWSEVEKKSRRQYVPFAARGFTAAALGYFDDAFALLSQAVEERDGILMFLKTERTLKEMRNDTRYAQVLAAMDLIPR